MIFRVAGTSTILGAAALLGACSMIGLGSGDEPPFHLATNPDGAQCELRGQEGFSSNLRSPASVTLPASAGPIAVRCSAPGYRTAFATLQKNGRNWIWSSAAGPVLALEQDRPRDLKIIERAAGQPLRTRPTW